MAEKKADAGAKPMNKSAIMDEIAKETDLTRKQVSAVFDSLTSIIKNQVGGKKGPGVINVFGLVKVYRVHKPATKAGTKPNPFKKGEMMAVKAKPARSVIKVRPLKE